MFPFGFFKKEILKPKRVRITFDSAPSTVTLTKHQLRFNKSFAYCWAMDDSLQDCATVGLPLFAGGNATYEDGLDLNLPGLHYTDGCGNKIAFDGGLCIVGSWILTGSTNNHYICTKDFKKMYVNNWGYVNHSYSHLDLDQYFNADPTIKNQELLAEIQNNYDIVKSYTGVKMNYFLAPSNYVPYSGVSLTYPQHKMVYGDLTCWYFDGQSVESLLQANNFRYRRTSLGDYMLTRTVADMERLSQYVSAATESYHPLIHESSHRMDYGEAQTDISINLKYQTAKDYFGRIANTYGSGGTDTVWFTNFQNVYEYLRCYQNVTYIISQNSNVVDIDFNFTNVDGEYRNHSLSFTISGNTNISSVTYYNFDTTSNTTTGTTSAMINISYKPKYEKSAYNRLNADVQVTDFEAIKTTEYQTIAQAAVNLLNNGAYKTSLQNRINAVAVIPDSRTFQIDFGSSTLTRPTPTPWNNMNGTTGSNLPSGTTVSNLLDTTSQSSNLSVVLTSSNWYVEDNGVPIATTGQSYPISATRDNIRVMSGSTTTTGTTEIRGCDDNKKYAINLLSARASIGNTTTFTVQGVSKTINPKNNLYTLLSWTDITSISGVITISAHQPTAGSYCYLNLIEIIET